MASPLIASTAFRLVQTGSISWWPVVWGIEVKIGGRRADLLRQLYRYAGHPEVTELLVVNSLTRHLAGAPAELLASRFGGPIWRGGVPVKTWHGSPGEVDVGGGGGTARHGALQAHVPGRGQGPAWGADGARYVKRWPGLAVVPRPLPDGDGDADLALADSRRVPPRAGAGGRQLVSKGDTDRVFALALPPRNTRRSPPTSR